MNKFKRFYQTYGLKSELLIAIILDFILILGHILLASSPDSPAAISLNNQIMQLIFAIIIQFYIGRSFYVLMYKELFKWHRLGMNTLVGISSLFAFAWSLYVFISSYTSSIELSHDNGYGSFFEIGSTIITFLLIGQAISDYLKVKVNRDITEVLELQIPLAIKYDPITKNTVETASRKLQVGDLILIQPQSRVPTDCLITENNSYFNESIITGESVAIFKTVNDELSGGVTNLTNSIVARVTKPVNQTLTALIIKRIKKLQTAKPQIQKISDKVSMWFVPLVLILGIISFIVHYFWGYQIQQAINLDTNLIPKFVDPGSANANLINAQVAVYFAIALVVISCPCALGIATPLAIAVGIGKAGRKGIVYNNIDIFEKTKKIDAICFDKTGTLTKGKLKINQVIGDSKYFDRVLELVQNSHHPISKTVLNYLNQQKIKPQDLNNLKEIPGVGISGYHNDLKYEIASFDYFKKHNYQFDSIISKTQNMEEISNNTNVCFAINQIVTLAFIINDELRDHAELFINLLKKQNLKLYLISGDNPVIVKATAQKLKIDNYYGGCSTFDKEKIIGNLQSQGYKVAFAGDGINDLIALEKADLSINMSLVNEGANAIADASVVDQSLMNIYHVISIAKKTRKLIILNFLWAFLYNFITIPLAFIGIVPTIIAVVLMGFSDFAVVLNTLIFRFLEFKKTKDH